MKSLLVTGIAILLCAGCDSTTYSYFADGSHTGTVTNSDGAEAGGLYMYLSDGVGKEGLCGNAIAAIVDGVVAPGAVDSVILTLDGDLCEVGTYGFTAVEVAERGSDATAPTPVGGWSIDSGNIQVDSATILDPKEVSESNATITYQTISGTLELELSHLDSRTFVVESGPVELFAEVYEGEFDL